MSDMNTNEVDGLSKDFYHIREEEQKDESQLTVDQGGNWQYPTSARTGYIEVELPTPPGAINPTERLHIRDFGGHVIGKLESAMQTGYLRSGPQQGPVAVFKHYAAVARGASLMDEAALKRMDDLATEFEKEPLRDEYYKQVVRPWLHSLAPKRRR
jgi:hypothetical protein